MEHMTEMYLDGRQLFFVYEVERCFERLKTILHGTDLKWEIDDVGDGRNNDRSTFFQKPGSESGDLLEQVSRILEISNSNAGL